MPSNEGEPINQPEEIPPSNDQGDAAVEDEGQEADTLGTDVELPEIEIVFDTPGFTLELENVDDLGNSPNVVTSSPPPATTGHTPSNDDP